MNKHKLEGGCLRKHRILLAAQEHRSTRAQELNTAPEQRTCDDEMLE